MASLAFRLDRNVHSIVVLAQIAAGGQRLDLLEAIFRLGFSEAAVPGGLLTVAVRTESLRSVRALVALGVPVDRPDASGKTPLMWASRYDDGYVAAFLLDAGADPQLTDDSGRTALDYARFHEAHDVRAVIETHVRRAAVGGAQPQGLLPRFEQ